MSIFQFAFSPYCAKTKGASVNKLCDINPSKSSRCSNNFKQSTFNPVFLSIDSETLIDVVMVVLRIDTFQYKLVVDSTTANEKVQIYGRKAYFCGVFWTSKEIRCNYIFTKRSFL